MTPSNPDSFSPPSPPPLEGGVSPPSPPPLEGGVSCLRRERGNSARVVLLSLDGLNHTSVSPETTPQLWALRASGGWAPDGGRCDVPAVTYVSHATLITGVPPATHGLTSNLAAASRPGTVPGWAGAARVRTPTLFDVLRDNGLRSAAICGDQNLVRIMGAQRADRVWPLDGILPEGTPLCPSGYALNEAMRAPLLAAAADRELSFLFGHLNETDTWGHRLGPEHPDTLRSYKAVDAIVGEVVAWLQPDWPRLVLIVLSDHGMEPLTGAEPVDLLAHDAVRATISDVVADAGVALARVRDGVSAACVGAALQGVCGVHSWRELRPGVLLIAAEVGVRFGTEPAKGLRGIHGGPGSTTTMALVAGSHPAVRHIATAMAARPPHLADWAPTIAALHGIGFPSAEGRNLLS